MNDDQLISTEEIFRATEGLLVWIETRTPEQKAIHKSHSDKYLPILESIIRTGFFFDIPQCPCGVCNTFEYKQMSNIIRPVIHHHMSFPDIKVPVWPSYLMIIVSFACAAYSFYFYYFQI
jgi:hypothetical protein